MAVQGIDLVSDTTVKELVEQIKYGNALRAAEAADSLATLKGDFKGIKNRLRFCDRKSDAGNRIYKCGL